MPVNMNPSNRRRFDTAEKPSQASTDDENLTRSKNFGVETEADREKDLADAENQNLWDGTEVIDMDQILPGSGLEK